MIPVIRRAVKPSREGSPVACTEEATDPRLLTWSPWNCGRVLPRRFPVPRCLPRRLLDADGDGGDVGGAGGLEPPTQAPGDPPRQPLRRRVIDGKGHHLFGGEYPAALP